MSKSTSRFCEILVIVAKTVLHEPVLVMT